MSLPEEFYIIPEEVFRVGNSTSPLLHKVRGGEVDVVDLNGVKVILANGKGVSVYNEAGLKLAPLSGWVWKFARGTVLPTDLKLVSEGAGHFLVAPARNMPVDKYKGILEEMGLKALKLFKKAAVQ
ncbi:MAG TPA: hypothetical protein VF950_25490 [Planctomycetota bacterium]